MVRVLLLLAIVVVCVGVTTAFVVSVRKQRRMADTPANLAKDMVLIEDLVDLIEVRAREMANLGDPFATTILDDISKYYRVRRQKREIG